MHQVRKAYRKGRGDFIPIHLCSPSACVVSECIHVFACAYALRVSVQAIPFGGVHTRTCVCVSVAQRKFSLGSYECIHVLACVFRVRLCIKSGGSV